MISQAKRSAKKPSAGAGPAAGASLLAGDEFFSHAEWRDALDAYRSDAQALEQDPERLRRAGWCSYHLGDAAAAMHLADMAHRLNPDDWQPSYLMTRALRAQRRADLALALLIRLAGQFPGEPIIRRDLAYVVYTELADLERARRLWQPLRRHPKFAASVDRYQLYSQFYEPDPQDREARRAIEDYVNRYVLPDRIGGMRESAWPPVEGAAPIPPAPLRRASARRRRIGLISVFFNGSPVFPLTIGALRAWADGVDLVFLDRGRMVADGATAAYRAVAREWHAVSGLPADVLHRRMAALKLDALIDMSGWSDTVALRALARKPAARLYKWVGGQAASTGIRAFDGFIGDVFQSPPELQPLYAEPLVNLPGGYATYSPPAYLPPGQAGDDREPVAGVVSNPLKLSKAFLRQLREAAAALDPREGRLHLRFVGSAYRNPDLQQRLRAEIQAPEEALVLEFVAPRGHENYLREVAQLDWVIDSWPYTGGLTILEALALGVPCRTRAGKLFCERHGYSHARYAGLDAEAIDLDALGPFGRPRRPKSGASLLAPDSPRLDHARMASALDALAAGKNVVH